MNTWVSARASLLYTCSSFLHLGTLCPFYLSAIFSSAAATIPLPAGHICRNLSSALSCGRHFFCLWAQAADINRRRNVAGVAWRAVLAARISAPRGIENRKWHQAKTAKTSDGGRRWRRGDVVNRRAAWRHACPSGAHRQRNNMAAAGDGGGRQAWRRTARASGVISGRRQASAKKWRMAWQRAMKAWAAGQRRKRK